MSAACRLRRFWLLTVAVIGVTAGAAENKGDTLVVSHVYNGYARTPVPGGGYTPETYSFAEGGFIDGEAIAADNVGTTGFDEVARTVAAALQSQGYVPGHDPEKIRLMIMLWYGSTRDTSASAVAPVADRPGVRSRNARLLGFQQEYSRAGALSFTDFGESFHEELYAGRYLVILKAYDFQAARKEKRLKLLWESRFSLRRQAVNFRSELPAMAGFAARTFGKETDGIFDPASIKGRVDLGELKILGEEKK
jgi:hypothetical protein